MTFYVVVLTRGGSLPARKNNTCTVTVVGQSVAILSCKSLPDVSTSLRLPTICRYFSLHDSNLNRNLLTCHTSVISVFHTSFIHVCLVSIRLVCLQPTQYMCCSPSDWNENGVIWWRMSTEHSSLWNVPVATSNALCLKLDFACNLPSPPTATYIRHTIYSTANLYHKNARKFVKIGLCM